MLINLTMNQRARYILCDGCGKERCSIVEETLRKVKDVSHVVSLVARLTCYFLCNNRKINLLVIEKTS